MSYSEKEYIVFCDESERKGKYYSNFYGGVIVGASQLNRVNERLWDAKADAGINSEVKWEKTSPYDVERYKRLIQVYFDEIAAGHLRTRIMYSQNAFVPKRQSREEYYKLYYQFIKNGFGFAHMPDQQREVNLRIYLDELPSQTKEQVTQFRGYLSALSEIPHLRKSNFRALPENVAEVDSKKHILLQCTDVVLGSISFRLNEKHKAIPPGMKRRGKRTLAKENLYRFIRKEICRVTDKPHFNIGISTGLSKHPDGLWSDPYLHWRFIPNEHTYDKALTKPK